MGFLVQPARPARCQAQAASAEPPCVCTTPTWWGSDDQCLHLTALHSSASPGAWAEASSFRVLRLPTCSPFINYVQAAREAAANKRRVQHRRRLDAERSALREEAERAREGRRGRQAAALTKLRAEVRTGSWSGPAVKCAGSPLGGVGCSFLAAVRVLERVPCCWLPAIAL